MKLRVLKQAEDELWEATFFYEDRRPGLGLSFYDRASEAMATIERDPLRFPLYEGKQMSRPFRRARVTGFPYIIVFEVREHEMAGGAIGTIFAHDRRCDIGSSTFQDCRIEILGT